MPANPPSGATVRRAIQRELDRLATDVLAEAKRQVPRELGDLRRSAVKESRWVGDRYEIVISFNTVYAARQHEETTWEHPRGGNAKYLEGPMRAAIPKVRVGLARAMKGALT